MAASFDRGQFFDGVFWRLRGKDEISYIWNSFSLFNTHIYLARTGVITYGLDLLYEVFREFFLPYKPLYSITNIGVREYSFTANIPDRVRFITATLTAGSHADNLPILYVNPFDKNIFSDFTAVVLKLIYHFLD